MAAGRWCPPLMSTFLCCLSLFLVNTAVPDAFPEHGDSGTGSSGWDVSAFSTSSHHPPTPTPLWSGTVLLRGLGEYKNKRGPGRRALISRFLVHYLRLFLTKLFFFFALFTWLLSASSHIFNLTSRQCSHFNSFVLQEAIKAFRVPPAPQPFFNWFWQTSNMGVDYESAFRVHPIL